MAVFLEILKFTIPSLILFFTVYFFLRTWSAQEDKKRKHEFNMHLQDDILPMRLQAYERIILFMERISPDNILIRINTQGITAEKLLKELQNTIRHEYEHNMTQQTYVSDESWKKVLAAKNMTLKIFAESYTQLNKGASGAALGKMALENVMEYKTPPTQAAIDFLKKEVKELFFHYPIKKSPSTD